LALQRLAWGATALTVLGGTHLAGLWSLPPDTFWAFSFVNQLPASARWAMALCVALSLLFVRRRPRQARPALNPSAGLTLVVCAVAGAVFWLLREHTHHGDAVRKLRLLTERTLQTDPYVWKEPLDSLVTYYTFAWLRPWGLPAEVAVAIVSVLAGVLYVRSALRIAVYLAPQTSQYIASVVGLLALGSSQLWFGHVENYSLVTAVAVAAMTQAVRFLRGHSSLWPVGLLSGLAVSFHPQAAFLTPALLVLLDRRSWRQRLLVLAGGGLVAPLLTILTLRLLQVPWPDMTRGFAGDSKLFLDSSEVFHYRHLLDVVNNLLLASPLAILWICIGFYRYLSSGSVPDKVLDFLTYASAGMLVYLLWFQNDLPRQQDWDLFAIVGPIVTIWGLYSWNTATVMSRSNAEDATTRAMWPALTLSSVLTIAWILLNHARPG
jgi:hypothetical protein